jgi:hypothetical protein
MWGDCQAWRNEIEESAADAAISAGARAHLSACVGCRAARDEGEKLRGLLGELDRIEPPPDFDFRLRARMAGRGTAARPAFSGRSYALGFVAAACVVALCALALLRTPSPGPETTSDHQASVITTTGETAARFAGDSGGRFDQSGEALRADVSSEKAGVAAATTQIRRRKSVAHTAVRERIGATVAARARGESVYGSYSAPIRTAAPVTGESAGNQRRPLAIPVGNTEEPLRVLLRDESGAVRFVPTRTVSFGAQQIVAREKGTRKVSSESQEGVW